MNGERVGGLGLEVFELGIVVAWFSRAKTGVSRSVLLEHGTTFG